MNKNNNNNNNINFEDILSPIFLFLTIVGFIFAIFYSFSYMNNPKYINIYLLLPFIFFLIPYLVLNLFKIKKVEAKMEIIPRFLRDIVDNIESEMDVVSAINNTINNEYITLNADIKKFANQLAWGIDFETAFINFADSIGSKSLKRDFILIIEARKIGGHFEKILRELSEKISTENLRVKERKSNLASNTFTGYISFIIFIFIIILVYNNLFVGFSETNNQLGENSATVNSQTLIFLSLLTFLSYELAILSGFLFGLMAENNIIAGAPHVVILVLMTFIGFFFFIKF